MHNTPCPIFEQRNKKTHNYCNSPNEQKDTSFMEAIKGMNLRDSDPEKQGFFAVYLLMKGKYIKELTKLLEESEMPIIVKLAICDFLVEEGFSDASETVEKTLVEICQIGRKEWQENKGKDML